jgi:hypothetical protein
MQETSAKLKNKTDKRLLSIGKKNLHLRKMRFPVDNEQFWIGVLQTNSKINNIRDLYRGINDIKNGYQPRTRIVKDEKGDLVADSYSIMVRWKNYFSQILKVHGVSDVRLAEIHTAELLVPEPSALDVELAIEKLKSHKSPGTDQIPAELIKAGGRTIRCAIHKVIIAIWNKEELPEEWKESIIVPIHKKGDKADCNNYRGIYHFCQLHTQFYPTSCSRG